MTKKNQIILTLLTSLVFGVACFVSWSIGFKQGMNAGGLTSSMAELMFMNNHIEDQMANATCEGAKQAINDYLKIIEKYKDVKNSPISGTLHFGDKMLNHARLARIEKQMGNHADEQNHMDIAKEACSQLKRQDCTEEKINLYAKRIEEKHPIACLANIKQ